MDRKDSEGVYIEWRKTLLERDTQHIDGVRFVYLDGDGRENVALEMGTDIYLQMGRPQHITVTVEPGAHVDADPSTTDRQKVRGV